MSRKNVQQILLLLVLASGGFALCVAYAWPGLIFAQESNDDTVTNRIFLPYVVSRGVATATIESTPTTGDGHNHSHPQPAVNAWPPQPEGVSDVVWIVRAPSDAVIAAQEAVVTAQQIAFASDAVQAALGDHFVQAATTYVHAKIGVNAAANGTENSKENDVVRVAYFSYSHNATVEAVVQAGVVTEIKTLDAAIYQPEPTRFEKQQATALARSYFAAQGFDRIQQLEGYVIQAYQAEGGTGFYATRVLYVTFHERIDERPEFVAWVDLTNATIIKGFQDSYQLTPDEETPQ